MPICRRSVTDGMPIHDDICRKVKTVGDLTERERRCTRKRWRKRQQESRMRHKVAATNTPPLTPDRDEEGESTSQRRRGSKARKRRDSAI